MSITVSNSEDFGVIQTNHRYGYRAYKDLIERLKDGLEIRTAGSKNWGVLKYVEGSDYQRKEGLKKAPLVKLSHKTRMGTRINPTCKRLEEPRAGYRRFVHLNCWNRKGVKL